MPRRGKVIGTDGKLGAGEVGGRLTANEHKIIS